LARSSRSKLVLALALLKELRAKVAYYSSMVQSNAARYREFAKRIERIDPARARQAMREAESLEKLRLHLERISLFIERVMIRLETLVTLGEVAASAHVLKGLVEEVKKSVAYRVPFISVAIDRIDSMARELMSEVRSYSYESSSSPVVASSEARKVIEEAKKVAGLA